MTKRLHLLSTLAFCLFAALATPVSGQDAEYELKFEGRWTSNLPRPGSAHFSTLVGATHNSAGSLFGIGQQASAGVEAVAELGATGTLVGEINAGIASGNVDNRILGTDGFISPLETNTFNFFANASHSQFSLLTMIAPSPDWFLGVHDLDLRDSNGRWKSLIELDLNSYDAGTENGTGLSLNNSATNPRGVIAALNAAEPNGALRNAGSLGRLTLTRISAVPEPSGVTLLVAGVVGLFSRRRR